MTKAKITTSCNTEQSSAKAFDLDWLFVRDDSPEGRPRLHHAAYLHHNGEVIIKPASTPRPPVEDFVPMGFVRLWFSAGTLVSTVARELVIIGGWSQSEVEAWTIKNYGLFHPPLEHVSELW